MRLAYQTKECSNVSCNVVATKSNAFVSVYVYGVLLFHQSSTVAHAINFTG